MAWVWLSSGFMLPLGMRFHSKRLPSGSIRLDMSSLTWQIGRKSTEQHGCYESRSIKLKFSDSPAYYTTVLHKYDNPAVFLREDTEEGAKLAKRTGGHLKTLQTISCISYILPYDWPSHLREQINRNFQFRKCHGKFFCSFLCIHGNNPRSVSVWGKRLRSNNVLARGQTLFTHG